MRPAQCPRAACARPARLARLTLPGRPIARAYAPSTRRQAEGVPSTTETMYVVRTNDGKPPREDVDEKGVPRTNVVNVGWLKKNETWQVRAVDAQTKKYAYIGCRKKWHDAVRLREEAQKTEGTHGPGELEFTAAGVAQAACCMCRHVRGIAYYAPEPCKYKKEFKQFKTACAELQSDDPNVAAAAVAALAVMPSNKKGNKALRRSHCRGCRDAKHRSQMEGPNCAPAKCLAANREIRADMALKGCQECTESRSECLTCEHRGRMGKPKGCKSILDPVWFAAKHGDHGPAEMWKAYRNRYVIVLCMCCHLRAPTHSAAMAPHSSTMEPGSKKRKQRENREANGAYNDAKKRAFVNVLEDGTELEPGQCFYCQGEYNCVEGYERAFQWMHRVDEQKNCKISTQLVGSIANPEIIKPRIDDEISGANGSGGCNLGCANCHFFYETLPRRKEGKELWDALMATPVRKIARA